MLYVLVTLRWWIIVRADAKHIPYLPLLGVRVSVFGVSYFTLGPQVGGEPLQVLFLQRKYGSDVHARHCLGLDGQNPRVSD